MRRWHDLDERLLGSEVPHVAPRVGATTSWGTEWVRVLIEEVEPGNRDAQLATIDAVGDESWRRNAET